MTEFRLADVTRRHARARPGAHAIVHGDRTLTYGDLDERSSRLAQALLAAGAGPGSRVAHIDQNAPEAVELAFAASKMGAVAVPVNWRLTQPEIVAVLTDAHAEFLIVGPSFAGMREDLEAELPELRAVVVAGEAYEALLAAHAADDPCHQADVGDPVLQLYTSGTTGVPKGVLLTHANLAGLPESDISEYWSVDESSTCLVAMPLFHIGGLGWILIGLWNGARNILISEIVPAGLLDVMESERVTNAFLVPTVLQMLTVVSGAGERDYSALRSIAYGASPITTPVLKAALKTFGCPLFQVYGLTETTGAITQLDDVDHDPGGPRERLLRSAGRPYPWVELKIVDPATGEDQTSGEVGEVWLRSRNNTPGYFNRPAETDALLRGDGWLSTGDGGYVDEEGYLFLTDRIKDMIVTGAENVYPIEVEDVLAQHPEVADVAVIGVPDERWGETVKAVVVARGEAEPSLEDLVAFARERLAGYKLPRSVDFVEELPRTPSGKVLKRELRDRYATG